MRPRTEISAAQVGAIHRAMLAAPNKSAFQRLQCLWLRASQELSTEAIAQAVGLSVSHVRRVWSEYLRGGYGGRSGSSQRRTPSSKPNLGPRTGRVGSSATASQTRRDRLRPGASKWTMSNAWDEGCPDSTVCRLLARHQWRRVTPRPKHPKDNPAARAAFKKTSGQSGRRGGWAPAPAIAADVRG